MAGNLPLCTPEAQTSVRAPVNHATDDLFALRTTHRVSGCLLRRPVCDQESNPALCECLASRILT